MSEHKFYVIGGEYTDSSFSRPVEGQPLETYGPFSEDEAKTFWRDITGRTVDNAMVRYVVKADDQIGGDNFYVVGGEYADTTFTVLADGKAKSVYGPFTREEALSFWRGITSQTVDSCLHRYDIQRM